MKRPKLSAFERLVCAIPLRSVGYPKSLDCWEWTGSRDAKGYGFISVEGRTRRVHIVAWELATGRKLRKGYTLQHKCRNPSCWRPSHVEVMSRSRNTADGNRNNPRSTEKARRRAAELRALAREPAPFASTVAEYVERAEVLSAPDSFWWNNDGSLKR